MGQLAEIIGVLEKGNNLKVVAPETKGQAVNRPVPMEKPGLGFPKLSMKSLFSLKQEKAFRPINLALISVLIIAGTLGFFFTREFQLRKQTLLQLTRVETDRQNLEQSVAQLRDEVNKQRQEVDRLLADLKAANAKAAMVDTLEASHRTEIGKMTKLYENQLQTLKRVLETREELMRTLETNFESIRKLLDRGVPTAASVIAIQSSGTAVQAGQFGKTVSVGGNVPSGQVLMVNQQHRFIIINFGPAEGAQAGRFVEIQNKGKSIGQARIERVYQTLSAASVLSDDTLRRVKTGDSVFLALS